MAGTGANADVVLLRDRVFLGQNTLLRLVVKLHAATEILLRPHTHHLTLVQGHIVEDVHFERPAEFLVLLLHENRKTVAPALRI